MIRFRSSHPALAHSGRAFRFVDGIADVPDELAPTIRSLARRRPWYGIVEEGPTPAPLEFRRPPRVSHRRERAEPRLEIVDRGSGDAP